MPVWARRRVEVAGARQLGLARGLVDLTDTFHPLNARSRVNLTEMASFEADKNVTKARGLYSVAVIPGYNS